MNRCSRGLGGGHLYGSKVDWHGAGCLFERVIEAERPFIQGCNHYSHALFAMAFKEAAERLYVVRYLVLAGRALIVPG